MFPWFVNEQVEEEKQVKHILEQVRVIGPSNSAIFLVDRDLEKASGPFKKVGGASVKAGEPPANSLRAGGVP